MHAAAIAENPTQSHMHTQHASVNTFVTSHYVLTRLKEERQILLRGKLPLPLLLLSFCRPRPSPSERDCGNVSGHLAERMRRFQIVS